MMNAKSRPTGAREPIRRWHTYLLLAVLAAIVSASLSGCALGMASASARTGDTQPAPTPITASQLEDQYGLRVAVLALTAAGGMVDLRLKVVDAAKAAGLLGKQPPALQVADTGTVLTAPEDSLPQDLAPVAGRTLFVLFPNTRNAVKPGAKVGVKFGDVLLEPLVVK
jgi:hypothetical protein